MPNPVRFLLLGLWAAWVAYWAWAARRTKATAMVEPASSQLAHLVPMTVAAVLIGVPHLPFGVLGERFVRAGPGVWWAGVGMTAAGLLFTVWARVHLGRNWSGVVTVKDDHELVTDGPYAWVRHPIYTGALVAVAGSALARGEWRGVVAFLLLTLALWRKLTFEDSWMRLRFGGSYVAYARRVRALVPFVV